MKKTLYLHIGAHKTGTTAIQHFLTANRKTLKQEGFLYPGHDYAHHDMAHEFCSLSLPEIRKNKNSSTCRLFNEINASRLHRVILSSEDFENLNQEIPSLKEYLVPDFLVRIIFYVRRQDDKLESAYNEYVKGPSVRYDKPILAFIQEKTGHFSGDPANPQKTGNIPMHSDYYAILRPWSEAFGRDNITVRCYEEEQLPEGIYHDFLDAIGLVLDTRYSIPKNRINKSLNQDLLEMIRLCNARFKNDNNFHQFLLKDLNRINLNDQGKKQWLLSPQQRREIISLYNDSNARVAHEYLGRSDGRLFYAPLPDLNESWEPHEDFTIEKFVTFFSQELYNLDRQIEQVRNRTIRQRIKQKIIATGSRLGLTPVLKYCYDRFYNS